MATKTLIRVRDPEELMADNGGKKSVVLLKSAVASAENDSSNTNYVNKLSDLSNSSSSNHVVKLSSYRRPPKVSTVSDRAEAMLTSSGPVSAPVKMQDGCFMWVHLQVSLTISTN